MQTHIVPVGFDYDRLIAPLVASVRFRSCTPMPVTLKPIAPDEAVRLYLRDRQTS